MALNQNDFPKIEKYINLKKFEVVKKGTLVITHENGFVTSVIFYKVPFEVLWNGILDFGLYPEFPTHIRSAKVREKDKEGNTWHGMAWHGMAWHGWSITLLFLTFPSFQ